MRLDTTQYDYPEIPNQELGQVPGATATPVFVWSSGEFDEMVVMKYGDDPVEDDISVVLNADEAIRLIEILTMWLTRAVDQDRVHLKPLHVPTIPLHAREQRDWLHLYATRFIDDVRPS